MNQGGASKVLVAMAVVFGVLALLAFLLLLSGCTAAQWQAFNEAASYMAPVRVERATIYCVVQPAGPHTVAISTCY